MLVTALALSACTNNDGPSAEQSAQLRTEFLIRAIDKVVVPGYAQLVTQTRALHELSGAFCETRDDAHFTALRDQWPRTMAAWQGMRWMNKGPIKFAYRFDRVEGWPRATAAAVKTRVDLLIKQSEAEKPPAMTRELIEKQPVQAQGLPALEYLLFSGQSAADYPANASGNRRCELLVAVADNLQTMADAVYVNWTTPELRDEAGRGVLGLRTEELSATFDTMANQIRQVLITMRHDQLGDALGITLPEQATSPNRYALQSGLSETSLDHIVVAISQLQSLMAEAGGDFGGMLSQMKAEAEVIRFGELLARVKTVAGAMDAEGLTLKQAITTPELVDRVVELYVAVKDADEYWQDVLMPASGARLTFNFNDGD